jgi:hypothetical protein
MIVKSRPPSTALVRFVTTGLCATIDSHLAGELPLHRFAWELQNRIDSLAELSAPGRTVTRLRWLQRTVEHLHAEVAEAGRAQLNDDEEHILAATLTDLRTVLADLAPHNPPDPASTARPTTDHRVVALHVVA